MKRVIILSPFKGDEFANVEYGWRCVIDSMRRGEAPWASHLFYTQIMNDADPAQRSLGFACEEAWLQAADLIVAYIDRGMSSGMMKTINMVSQSPEYLIPIEIRSLK